MAGASVCSTAFSVVVRLSTAAFQVAAVGTRPWKGADTTASARLLRSALPAHTLGIFAINGGDDFAIVGTVERPDDVLEPQRPAFSQPAVHSIYGWPNRSAAVSPVQDVLVAHR